MIEALSFEFMQNALIAGILISLLTGIIGSLIVVNRMVFLAGGIAHTAYGGIGIAIYFSIPIFLGASLFAVASAILIAILTLRKRERIDTFIGLIWSVGMAIGVILIDITPGYNTDLMSYLFGSILAVSREDIYIMFSLFIVVLLIVTLKYREILAVSYDSEYAKLRGINIAFFYTLILILSALTVVISIKVVGLILIIAMLTIPIYIAQSITSSLGYMMFLSSIFASIFTTIGLWFSYNYDLTSGATIIIVSASFLILFLLFSSLKKR